jgi:hypothetical protein
MDTHHHKGDVTARTISPERAFLFARLRIGDFGLRVSDFFRPSAFGLLIYASD